LTAPQEAALKEGLGKLNDEIKAASRSSAVGGPPIDFGAMRQRMTARVEQTLGPLLDEKQRPLLERWKSGRENTRGATVWVLGTAGEVEPRFVRLGLTDDRFTEIVGGGVAEGANVVVRARESGK